MTRPPHTSQEITPRGRHVMSYGPGNPCEPKCHGYGIGCPCNPRTSAEDDAANECPGDGCSCYGNVELHNLPSAESDVPDCTHPDDRVAILLNPFGTHVCQDCGQRVEAVWRVIAPAEEGQPGA
ncbi:hypothetical protein GCM10027273_11660 [Nocardioides pakistanensis]